MVTKTVLIQTGQNIDTYEIEFDKDITPEEFRASYEGKSAAALVEQFGDSIIDSIKKTLNEHGPVLLLAHLGLQGARPNDILYFNPAPYFADAGFHDAANLHSHLTKKKKK